jgi:Domain of unknown function (DUF5076)
MGRMKLKPSKPLRKRPGRELVIPPQALGDPAATEIARLWVTDHGPLHVSLDAAFEMPGAWGILLVDVARHVARMYRQAHDADEDEVFQEICTTALELLSGPDMRVPVALAEVHRSGQELVPPRAALKSPTAREVARIWITANDGPTHVSLDIAFPSAGTWGVLFADVARHVARMYRPAGTSVDDAAVEAISEMFAAEAATPLRQGHNGGLTGDPS